MVEPYLRTTKESTCDPETRWVSLKDYSAKTRILKTWLGREDIKVAP